ncbi:MAG: hypothetical protein KF791_15405 [Verrucomicrobiae bacterium]|nr:hypothetical protein [Verrucomicrobiae bacterium]
MGYLVESYSLDELHRIAVPGAVAPSLFWVLPVGEWRAGELEEVWRWFTERQSECHDYGLLLVKHMGRRESDEGSVNLAPVGAKLSDLMPAGAERFVSPSAVRGEAPRVLVLAGGYPQPGWGVLVEWRRRDIHRFEGLLRLTTGRLRNGESANELSVFKDAAASFHRWTETRDARPAKLNVSSLETEIAGGEQIEVLMRDAESALQAGQHALVQQKVNATASAAKQAAWLGIEAATLREVEDLQQTFASAAFILALPAAVIAAEIEPKLDALVSDPSKRESVYKSLASQDLKHALRECLNLRRKGVVPIGENFSVWAEQTKGEVQPPLAVALANLRQTIEAKLAAHRGAKAQRDHEHEVAVNSWRDRSKQAREAFHAATGKAVELQWKLGPQFLVAFEHTCHQQGLWVRSVPWDAARMVGWKLMASQVKLDARDLQIAAQELAPEAAGANSINGPAAAVADGSYFTDYVHHIAISKTGFSPRTVTRDLLVRLLRPAEMMALIQTNGGEPPEEPNAPRLAAQLLHVFGWRESDEARERSLAGCISAGKSAPVLSAGLTGNDLRIVLESFCKDIVDVVVVQLGYSHSDVWGAIEERIPDYRPSSRTKDWEEEVRVMTVGSAEMILAAFGPLAFPSQSNTIGEFASNLRQLSELLNRSSHHREGDQVPVDALDGAATMIHQLLGQAGTILGELPWHLNASLVYGEQPKVLSGEAWSHGCHAPRLLRVILWTGTSPGTHVTLWNKTRRNPIVTDPVFITRPHRA